MNNKQTSALGNPRLGYSVAETAVIIGVSPRSVYRLLERGLLRGSRALRTIIIPQTEIIKFLIETTEGV